jgi:hypothetical protein
MNFYRNEVNEKRKPKSYRLMKIIEKKRNSVQETLAKSSPKRKNRETEERMEKKGKSKVVFFTFPCCLTAEFVFMILFYFGLSVVYLDGFR